MNLVHSIIAALLIIFIVLWAAQPTRPTLALVYLRVALLVAATAMILSPFLWLVCAVVKDPYVLNEYTFLPPLDEWGTDTLNFDNFRELFAPLKSQGGTYYFWLYILNSLFLATTQTTIQLLFCSMGGYALAKYAFRGRNALLLFMLASMTIPPILLLSPVYKIIVSFGWADTWLALLAPGAVNVFGILLFRQAMLRVPDELIACGRIDGCSEFCIYWRLAMPLVRPMTGAFCLISFMSSWNSFIAPNIFLNSAYKLTLPVILQQYVGQYQQQYGVFLAGTFLAIIPPAILFLTLEREFISGLTSGAVKG